jgi:hypothetical protein
MNVAGSLSASLSPSFLELWCSEDFGSFPFFPAGVLLTGALILAFLIDAEKLVIDS